MGAKWLAAGIVSKFSETYQGLFPRMDYSCSQRKLELEKWLVAHGHPLYPPRTRTAQPCLEA